MYQRNKSQKDRTSSQILHRMGCLLKTAFFVQGRVACLQSLSGTGSLRVGANFIAKWLPGKDMYISNPTWGNHRNIFNDAGLEWKYYRYFNPDDISLDFAGMMEDIKNAPDGSVIVLHGAYVICACLTYVVATHAAHTVRAYDRFPMSAGSVCLTCKER
jgi:Aminotransferase class I and II